MLTLTEGTLSWFLESSFPVLLLFPIHHLKHRANLQSFSIINILIQVLTEIPSGFCLTEWRVLTGFSIFYHFITCIIMPSSLTHFWGCQHNKDIRYFIINIKSSRYFNHLNCQHIISFNFMPLPWEFPQLYFFVQFTRGTSVTHIGIFKDGQSYQLKMIM